MSAYKGVSSQVHILSFGSAAFCKSLISLGLPRDQQQQNSVWIPSPLITFLIPSPAALYAAPGAGTWNSCTGSRNRHNSTVRGRTVTASTALPGALNSHPRLKKKKKKIAISLIAAKWHTKRKLTIGCYLHSQSDSDLPASLSPFWCQADYSLPISFRPRQPKKALPHRATTSSLFWY